MLVIYSDLQQPQAETTTESEGVEMRALILEDFGRMAVVDRASSALAPTQVRIAVEFVGICGTDLHGYAGRNGRRIPGQVMGHEAAGTISELGSEVTRFALGDRVTFNPVLGCGDCLQCERGQSQRCLDRVVVGVDPTVDGAYATHVAVPASVVHRLPDGMPMAHGALIEPVAVALHAVRRSGLTPGESVLILGGGPIGQSAILAARAVGAARILIIEPDADRRELCERLGATAVDPASGVTETVVRLGGLVERAIDAVGVEASIRDAVDSVTPDGTVALVGMGSPRVEFEPYAVTTAEKSIVGSYCYSDQGFADAVALVAADAAVARLIAEVVDLADAASTFGRLGAGDVAGKVLIRLDPAERPIE
jgi:threonine dehydrogenase-like Zn-dependent dehydrogenase